MGERKLSVEAFDEGHDERRMVAREGMVERRLHTRYAVDAWAEVLVKDGDVGDDEERAAQARVQKVTDDHVSKIDELLKRKEAEIMEV